MSSQPGEPALCQLYRHSVVAYVRWRWWRRGRYSNVHEYVHERLTTSTRPVCRDDLLVMHDDMGGPLMELLVSSVVPQPRCYIVATTIVDLDLTRRIKRAVSIVGWVGWGQVGSNF